MFPFLHAQTYYSFWRRTMFLHFAQVDICYEPQRGPSKLQLLWRIQEGNLNSKGWLCISQFPYSFPSCLLLGTPGCTAALLVVSLGHIKIITFYFFISWNGGKCDTTLHWVGQLKVKYYLVLPFDSQGSNERVLYKTFNYIIIMIIWW